MGIPDRIKPYLPFASAFLAGLLSLAIVWGLPRQAFWAYLLCFAGAHLAWLPLFQYQKKLPTSPRILLGGALLVRLLLVPALPNLSDDFYRFLWDGLLLNEGTHPFAQVPADFGAEQLSDFQEGLRQKMNSPAFFTIYPPLAQGTFGLATALGGEHLRLSVALMKLGIFAAEAGTLFLLFGYFRGRERPHRWLLYAFNPLVLLELCGNLHFEAYMVFFTVLALVLFEKGRPLGAGLALAGGVGAKLLPLIFLPALLRNRRPVAWFWAGMGCTGGTLLLFWPLWDAELWAGMRESLGLYFQQFEFNASLYYLLRAWGHWAYGYNIIGSLGPLLSVAVFVLVMGMALLNRRGGSERLAELWLFALLAYLSLATIVHPWYVVPLVALSLFTRWRFAYVWGFLVGLSYSAYQDASYTENLWLVGLEYAGLFGFLVWEIAEKGFKKGGFLRRKQSKPTGLVAKTPR